MRQPLALRLVLTPVLVVVLALLAGLFVDQSSTAEASHQPQTTTVTWGPFTLPAADANGPGQLHNTIAKDGGCSWITNLFAECIETTIEKPCSNCYITEMRPNLVDSNTGETVNFNNGGMLHHVVNVNFSRDDPTCPPNLFGKTIQQLGAIEGGNERFFAAGNERTFMQVPAGYGYYLGAGDELGLIFHLMNMTPQPRNVSFEYTFTWVSSAEHVKPIWFDIDQCNDSEVDMAAGYNDVHWSWNSRLQGTIVAIGGHVHDYGIDISLVNDRTGEVICDSVAGYAAGSPYAPVGPGAGTAAHAVSANVVGSDPLGLANYAGHISDMTICQPFSYVRGPRWWGLIPGDRLTLHTQYFRPNATDHDMGIMVAYMDLQ
jgi:hypothetical protein